MIFGNNVECMIKKLLEMIWAHLLRLVAES